MNPHKNNQAKNATGPLTDPATFLRAGRFLVKAGKAEQALDLIDKAMAAHAGDPLWQALAQAITTHDVPQFHQAMLHDAARNRAYRQAIERFAPGRTVLDIGTGSGLLAMMAARAGARRVYACEANPLLATAARKVIAANGLADKIVLLDRHSGKLDRLKDLDGGVDMVVSEVFSDNLLGENVLPTLDHARAELCNEGAIFLPEHAEVTIALADRPVRPAQTEVEGFDLTSFDPYLAASPGARPSARNLMLRSQSATLFAFDFAMKDAAGGGAWPKVDSGHASLTSAGGNVSCIAQWIALRFAPDIAYENNPCTDPTLHWRIRLTPAVQRQTSPGEQIRVDGWHNSTLLALWEGG